jgi:hypothetical protein
MRFIFLAACCLSVVQVLAQDPASMTELGVISGRVFDEQGHPVPSTKVVAYHYGYDENGNGMVVAGATEFARTTETDAHGEFRITDLKPGEYFVSVEPEIPGERRVSDGRSRTTTYYPGTTDPANAVAIHVRGGEEYRLNNITLLSVRLATVRMHIIDSTGEAASGNKFVAWGMSAVRNPKFVPGQAILPGLTHGVEAGSDDPEILNLPPASYGFSVSVKTVNGTSVGRTIIDVNEVDIQRDVEVRPNLRLTGTVVLENENGNTAPLPGVQVIMLADGFGYRLQGISQSDGVFAIDGVTERTFRLQFLDLPDDAYVATASDGSLDALRAPLRVIRDIELQIVVRPNGSVIEGVVTDIAGNKIAESVIVLIPDARDESVRYLSATSDESGGFTIKGIAPGAYRLFAWSELEGAPYRNTEFMKRYEESGIPISVEKAGHLNIDVKIVDDPQSD